MLQNWKFLPKFQNNKIEIKNIGQEWVTWTILNFASLFVVFEYYTSCKKLLRKPHL
jgi:hypothetical protein